MFSKSISLKKITLAVLALGTLAQPTWAATNIDKCQTLSKPGVYNLTRDLTTSSDCFHIAASNITLDLGGHTISGDGNRFGVVDSSDETISPVGITVRNGWITNFFTGIQLGRSYRVTLQHLRVFENTSQGIIVGPAALIENGDSTDNGGAGILAGAGSILRSLIIRGNGDSDTDFGIGVSSGSRVESTTVSQNFGHGIVAKHLDDTIVLTGNVVRETQGVFGTGIRVECPARVVNNQVYQNSRFNIFTDGNSKDCILINNQ